jgi:hypothetical protein
MSGGSISQRKLAANRANALLSTGPRTFEGKARSGRNALKHGLLSSQILLEHEDPDELAALKEGLYSDIRPVGALEETLVEKIVACAWLQKRALRAETALMEHQYRTMRDAFPLGDIAGEESDLLATSGMLSHAKLDGIQRYETSKERQMYRALHELQRLQAARQSAMPLVPMAVDVDVTGNGPSPQ